MSALRLQAMTAARGGRIALSGVDIAFASGRLTAVIGPNGAGKSTLLEAAAGLLAPVAGTVSLDGSPLTEIPRRQLAQRRAYLPQNPHVDWAISVARVVALGLTAHLPAFGGLPEAWRARIDSALTRFDLGHLRDRSATELSGGELARVMLARATVGEPEVLIVDEPTAGLDPRHAIDAMRHLRAIADGGCTVIAALHDLDLAARFADEIVAIRDSKLFAAGPARETLTAPNLAALYDVNVRLIRDEDGVTIRFS